MGKGVVNIDEQKRIDWNKIRTEYIAGGISQRKIAKKYGVSAGSLMEKANRERWADDRRQVASKALASVEQKTADAVADNAVIAQRIRTKLLKRLEKEIDNLPETMIGSESFNSESTANNTGKKNSGRTYKFKDLTAAWKELTEGMEINGAGSEKVEIIWDIPSE